MPNPAQVAEVAQVAAQASEAMDGTLVVGGGTGLIATLGGLLFKLHQVFNKTIPRIVRDFDERLAKQQDVFLKLIADLRNDIREQRADFLNELKSDRAENRVVIEKLSSAIDRLDQTIQRRAP